MHIRHVEVTPTLWHDFATDSSIPHVGPNPPCQRPLGPCQFDVFLFRRPRTLTIKDELGVKPMKGVLVRPTPTENLHNFRIIRMYSEAVQVIEETVLTPSTRLREDEPYDTLVALTQSRMEKYPDTSRRRSHHCRFVHASYYSYFKIEGTITTFGALWSFAALFVDVVVRALRQFWLSFRVCGIKSGPHNPAFGTTSA